METMPVDMTSPKYAGSSRRIAAPTVRPVLADSSNTPPSDPVSAAFTGVSYDSILDEFETGPTVYQYDRMTACGGSGNDLQQSV
jgi:hypothetical protein